MKTRSLVEEARGEGDLELVSARYVTSDQIHTPLELATAPMAASLGNAVFYATGRFLTELSSRPARVLEAPA